MKKNILLIGVTTVVLLGGAVGVGAIANDSKALASKESIISIEKAKDIASKEAEGAKVESIELEREHGQWVYDVDLDFPGSDDDIEVDVSAVTGEVVKVDDDRDDTKGDVSNNTSTNNAPKSVSDTPTTKQITIEEAVEIATKDTQGKIVEAEYDDDGYYEIEMKHEGNEIEFKISAKDGSILKKEVDNDDNDNK
ncbi:PepSY domain-containing protein [Fredinandcohnia sp. 179-A 10B2 NHS]|uniref:PepSY domain-containing protein n=1 Tax=Fredinandcohnia sp. 179-A 10B2 NHS TaxID=3235176 RepID=UPI0039A37267